MSLRNALAPPAFFLAILSSAPVIAADELLPKADRILDKFVEATGGKSAYEKIHNEKWTGSFEFVGKGIKGTVTSYRAEPNKTVTIVELEGVGTVEDGTDGETAWTRSAMQGPRIKEGDERAASLREAMLRGPLYWRKLFRQAETAGVENVGDQACYKVVLTPNEGKPETHYYDKKSNLLVKMTMTIASPMGEIPTETLLSDYKEESGVLQPHKVHQKAMGQEFLITMDHMEYNVDIPKDRFDLPADVKALRAK
jgi:hypothetical protein